jgi:metallopeptidase MepB
MDHAQESSRRPPQPPPDFAAVAEPTSILQTSNKLCENFQQVVNNLVRTVTPENATFNNVVRQLLQHENEMQLTSNLITMIAIVSPDKTLRNSAS